MRKIELITTTCRRCGKPLTTTNKSIYGADKDKEKYDRICKDCATPEELQEILRLQAEAILKL